MIAAMMTAANLGARVTGWGFVVFTIGSIAWSTIGLASGQTNLLATNAFLTLVNLVGVWRWLGRQKTYEDGGKSAEVKSRRSSTRVLLTATGLSGIKVHGLDGTTIGTAVEALVECDTAAISYVVVSRTVPGGIAEELRAVPRDAFVFGADKLRLLLAPAAFEALPLLDDGDWPAAPPAVAPMRVGYTAHAHDASTGRAQNGAAASVPRRPSAEIAFESEAGDAKPLLGFSPEDPDR